MYKATIERTSGWHDKEEVELKTLDELVNYVDKYDCDWFVVHIISPTEIEIEIYDDYRE